MDTHRDFAAFRDLMDDLTAALRDGFKASDASVRSYFDALKDVPIGEIRGNVKRIIATATSETKFPRPASLRNRPSPTMEKPPDVAHEKAEREAIREWRALKARDPVAFEVRFRSARAFFELAQSHEEDPEHEQWSREYQRWHALEYAPRAEQEVAVAKYLGAASNVAANDPDFDTEEHHRTGTSASRP